MKRSVLNSKENKRSLRWLQAAGQCKAPFTVIIDLSFARSMVREAVHAPSLKPIAIPHFDGNATKVMNDKLDVPCRVVVTAATMVAAEKYRNEVRDKQQQAQQEQRKLQQQQFKQQQKEEKERKAASATTAHDTNKNKNKAKAAPAAGAAVVTSKAQKQQLITQQKLQQAKHLNGDADKNFVEEDFRMANDVKAFLKTCELWSPSPSQMEARGPGKEHKAIAEAVLFGRPGLEERPADAHPSRHGVILATHNPDNKSEVSSALRKMGAMNTVAVCTLRCLTKPFSLRLEPLNDDHNIGNSSNNSNIKTSSSSNQQHSFSNNSQPQKPLTQRAMADLHFIKKLKDQNLISNGKANYVVTQLGGHVPKNNNTTMMMSVAAKRIKDNNERDAKTASGGGLSAEESTALKIVNEAVPVIEKKQQLRQKKSKKETQQPQSNPLATKKKMVRVPLKVSKS